MYKSKQEREFLKTFLPIMDKMSTDLADPQQNYRNIAQPIEKDQKCVRLTRELKFFKDEYMELSSELAEIEVKTEGQQR